MSIKKEFPDGHYYSPLNSINDIKSNNIDNVFNKLDYNHEKQQEVLSDMKEYLKDFDYDDKPTNTTYHLLNSMFGLMDGRSLFYFIRSLKPKNIIEIGSGRSTLLMNDVNNRYFNGKINITCIEPYPPEYLLKIKNIKIIQQKVQDVPLSIFNNLSDNDILFIDSSHVAKSQSDVVLYYTDILPNLNKNVYIHIHDIFFPDDYPYNWIIERHWNEQYMLYAFLMFNKEFEVQFGCNYVFKKCTDQLKDLLKDSFENKKFGTSLFGGCSFWIKRV